MEPLLELFAKFYPYRAVVGAHDFGQDEGLFEFWNQLFLDKEIVNAPADIALTGIRPVAPPSVVAIAIWGKVAERVNKTSFNDSVYAFALFLRIAVFALIRFWIRQIVRSVRNIEVTAKNNWFLFF